MKFILSSTFLLALFSSKSVDATGGDGYTYYELGGLGPSNWPYLQLDGNQCGGTQGQSGYGQSPVTIGQETTSQCHTNMVDYKFNKGDCTWSDLQFTMNSGGVKAEPKLNESGEGAICNFGTMNIPHSTNEFNALQFHIHTSSEHVIEGTGNEGFFPAELHVVHQESTDEGGSYAVFGTMIDVGGDEHPMFEGFLQGWESVAQDVDDSCTVFPGRDPLANTVQKVLECKAPGVEVWGPNGNNPTFPTSVMPNVYELPTNKDFGTFTYKGGLTTPGCTEIVNWNLLDTPMLISQNQMDRLQKLILCYVARDVTDDGKGKVVVNSCTLGTVASETGSTSRPPQDLMGRTVIHRCRDGPNEVMDDIGVLPPPPDSIFVKPRPPNEPLNTGPNGKCEKSLYEDCSEDKRYDNMASPNLRLNNDGWNNIEGLWVGKRYAFGVNGDPKQPEFAKAGVENVLPYTRDEVTMFINTTISQTRLYQHVYVVYPPASDQFCSLPVPEGSTNQLGSGKCGTNGLALGASRYGTANHEKDGVATIFFSNGFFDGAIGESSPVGNKAWYTSIVGPTTKLSETATFTNLEKTRMAGSGQLFIISNVPPYSVNPLAESYSWNLEQVNVDNFNAAIQDALNENTVPDNMRNPMWGDDCIFDVNVENDACPSNEMWSQNDPRETTSPYQQDPGIKGGYIFLFIFLGFLVICFAGYVWHKRAMAKSAERYRRQFAAAIAGTINLDHATTPEELEEQFKKIDVDGNGVLTKKELRSFMSGMDGRDFEAMFAAIDIDGSGSIEFAEFCAFIAMLQNNNPATTTTNSAAAATTTSAAAATKPSVVDC